MCGSVVNFAGIIAVGNVVETSDILFCWCRILFVVGLSANILDRLLLVTSVFGLHRGGRGCFCCTCFGISVGNSGYYPHFVSCRGVAEEYIGRLRNHFCDVVCCWQWDTSKVRFWRLVIVRRRVW